MPFDPIVRPHAKRWLGLVAIGFAALLAACEGVGIPATDDPEQKLAYADDLLHHSGRVMQARRQTEEAMAIFEQRGDKLGLAHAYRMYGLIARADGMGANPVVQRDPRAPLNPTTASLDLADSYLNRAAALSVELNELYMLSNLYYLLGSDKVLRGQPQQSCDYYDKALATSREAQRQRPGVAVGLMPGYATVESALLQAKREAGCSAA